MLTISTIHIKSIVHAQQLIVAGNIDNARQYGLALYLTGSLATTTVEALMGVWVKQLKNTCSWPTQQEWS